MGTLSTYFIKETMNKNIETTLNLAKTDKSKIDMSEIEKSDKKGLKKNRHKMLLILSAISIFCVTILGVILSINFYLKEDYIIEFSSENLKDPKGFTELKGCFGKIRFQPGFRQGDIFEKTTP